jgi:ribosomal RNA-processing protein 36
LLKRKREEREAVVNGKSAFYLKRKDKKKIELQAKFQDLQESGKLSKFMAKKRKKNASKDHRWLPTNRKE